MQTSQRRAEARSAKAKANMLFAADPLVTGVGLGRTADGSDYVVLVMVANRQTLNALPKKIGTVPVVGVLAGVAQAY